MIKSISDRMSPVEIDLTGPQGNAFVLLGHARQWSRQMGLDPERVQFEMMEGDYENLVQVLERYFGDFIVLYR